MHDFEIFLAALFVSVAGLNVVARWLVVPYPIPLVLGGLVLGLIPGMPEIELDPDLVLLIFLPPLLYSAAFFSDLRALRANLRPISLLAIGLVLATTVAVAVRRARGDRPALGDGVRARRDRLADRPGGGHARSCAGSARRGGS